MKDGVGPADPLLPSERRGSVNAVREKYAEVPEYISPVLRQMSVFASITTVCNAVIGTGILALPVAFSRLGWAMGTVVMIVCGSMTFISLCALGSTCTTVGATTYGHMMVLAVGPKSGKFTSALVFANSFSVCVAYSLVIAQNINDLMFDQGWITDRIVPDSPLDNRRFWIVIPTLCIIIPLCMLPNYDALRSASLAATSSMVYLTGVIVVYMAISASRSDLPVWAAGAGDAPIGPRNDRVTSALLQPEICCVPPYTPADGIPGCAAVGDPDCCPAGEGEICCDADILARGITPWSGAVPWIVNTDIFSSFSIFVFAFYVHPMVPQVVVELVEPSPKRLGMMMGGISLGTMSMYYLVGLSGYLLFGACVCDNISVSFGPNVLVAIGQGFVVMSVCAGYATNAWPARDAILELAYPLYLSAIGHRDVPGTKKREPSLALKRVLALIVVVVAAGVAWFAPPFEAVLAILGAVGGGLMAYIMPSLAYMQVYHKDKSPCRRLFTLPGLCLVLSCIFFCVNNYYVLGGLFFGVSQNEGDAQDRSCLPPDRGV